MEQEARNSQYNGLGKKSDEKFSDAEYKRAVRDLGDDYLASFPRRVAE